MTTKPALSPKLISFIEVCILRTQSVSIQERALLLQEWDKTRRSEKREEMERAIKVWADEDQFFATARAWIDRVRKA